MFLGIDVGGSTSDILLLAKDTDNSNQSTLYRESSVRLAAGVLYNAVIVSDKFRQALLNFHESKKTDVYVANINEILTEKEKAPYYLNSIFDQLKTKDDYEEFYSSISADAKSVFSIPAYVTGLLLFYSGMLIGKTIKTQQLDNISKIDILSFGKGGRLFHWLRNAASSRVVSTYYTECLNTGVQIVVPDKTFEVKYRDEIENDNKAEVAKGLCNIQEFPQKGNSQASESDICGENGVKYTMQDGSVKDLKAEDELTGEYFANEMNNFDFSGIENFEKFLNIYIDFVSQKTKLYDQADKVLREDLQELPNKIASFIKNKE